MKNIWKWILGIVVVLVVVAGLVGLAFVMHKRMAANMVYRTTLSTPPVAPGGPPNGNPPGRFGGRIPPRMGPRMGFHGFGTGFRGFGPFAPGLMFFGMLGRLVPFAILALLLYGAYRLGKGKAPVVTTVAAAPPTPEPLPAVPTHPCPKCENPVQDGWKHCPNCGEEQH